MTESTTVHEDRIKALIEEGPSLAANLSDHPGDSWWIQGAHGWMLSAIEALQSERLRGDRAEFLLALIQAAIADARANTFTAKDGLRWVHAYHLAGAEARADLAESQLSALKDEVEGLREGVDGIAEMAKDRALRAASAGAAAGFTIIESAARALLSTPLRGAGGEDEGAARGSAAAIRGPYPVLPETQHSNEGESA